MTTSKYEMKYLFYALVSKNTSRQKMHAILARYCSINCISMLSFSLLYALNTAEMHRNYNYRLNREKHVERYEGFSNHFT